MATKRVTAAVRQATSADVGFIAAMIRELAHFERLADACVATEEDYASTLFKAPALQGPTVLLLELPLTDSPPSDARQNAAPPGEDCTGLVPVLEAMAPAIEEELHQVEISSPLDDDPAFKSSPDRIVAGFVLFFPNYSTFLAKPGLYIEDLYVREPFRRQGLGTVLLSTVARLAVMHGFGRVEWCVLDWNVNAIDFYKGMGAQVLQDWRICRLAGDALSSYAKRS